MFKSSVNGLNTAVDPAPSTSAWNSGRITRDCHLLSGVGHNRFPFCQKRLTFSRSHEDSFTSPQMNMIHKWDSHTSIDTTYWFSLPVIGVQQRYNSVTNMVLYACGVNSCISECNSKIPSSKMQNWSLVARVSAYGRINQDLISRSLSCTTLWII